LYLVQTISQILVVWVWIELVKKWVKGIWDFFFKLMHQWSGYNKANKIKIVK
jgi:hypothetical protein